MKLKIVMLMVHVFAGSNYYHTDKLYYDSLPDCLEALSKIKQQTLPDKSDASVFYASCGEEK